MMLLVFLGFTENLEPCLEYCREYAMMNLFVLM